MNVPLDDEPQVDGFHIGLVEGAIYLQPTIKIPQWIPCSERLPENHGYYVVTAEMDNDRYIRMAVYDRYGFGVRMFETVVAWMNIEEYKGE